MVRRHAKLVSASQ